MRVWRDTAEVSLGSISLFECRQDGLDLDAGLGKRNYARVVHEERWKSRRASHEARKLLPPNVTSLALVFAS
jgi:hypothetical protein